MVDMNVIVLEGIVLYIVLGIVLFMVISVLVLAFAGVKQDEKIDMLNAEVTHLNQSNNTLSRENFRYRLKYGSFDTEEDVADVGNNM